MPSGRERRLARLEAAAPAAGEEVARHHRRMLRFQVRAAALIRAAAAAAGVDPAAIPALHIGDSAADQLAALGDTPELARADAAANEAAMRTRRPSEPQESGAAALLRGRLDRLRAEYAANGGTPQPGASFMAWFVWASLHAPRNGAGVSETAVLD